MNCPRIWNLFALLLSVTACCTWDWNRFGASQDASQDGEEDSSLPICFQAESGNLTLPMTIVTDERAEGNLAITCPGMESDCRDRDATAVYRFSIETPGLYRVQARVWALNAGDDSIFFSMDDAELDTWHWNPGIDTTWYGTWQYDDVSLAGVWDVDGRPEFDPALFELDVGQHIIRLEGRESEGLIDSFCVVPHQE